MSVPFDVAVVGGGIVGTATALELLTRSPKRRVLLCEKETSLASHQTGHNSGVLHSGLYYAPGSWKARLCREGRDAMIAFCRREGVPIRIGGKLVVATSDDELPRLERLHERATANGVAGVTRLDAAGLREVEPAAAGLAALRVPETGVVHFPDVVRRMSELFAAAGGEVRTGTRVLALGRDGGDRVIETDRGELRARRLVFCAGLQADRMARADALDPGIAIVPFRGEYLRLSPKAAPLVRESIYPVPDPAFPFLGVHLTRDLSGVVEAGPSAVMALAREGYGKWDVSPRDLLGALAFPGVARFVLRHARVAAGEVARSLSRRRFGDAVRRLVPAIADDDLEPALAGIRAQAMRPDGTLVEDFLFVEGPGSLHLLNAPSPAATASLAIAREIADRLEALG